MNKRYRNRRYLLFLLAVSLLVSCSQDNLPGVDTGDRVPVTFTTNIGSVTAIPNTRVSADGNQWSVGDSVGIFMIETGETLSDIKIMNNRKYTVQTGNNATADLIINGTPAVYYPNDDKVDFIAYHPYQSTLSDYKFSVSVPPNQKDDNYTGPYPLYAKADNNGEGYYRHNSAVELPFKHVLSKLNLTVQAGAGLTASDLLAMTVEIEDLPISAQFNVKDATFESPTQSNIILKQITNGQQYEAILIPYAGSKLIFTLDSSSDKYICDISDITFESGKQYNFNIVVRKTAATIEGCTISDWGNGTGGDLGSMDEVSITTFNLGDYIKDIKVYYTDGTNETIPDGGRTLVTPVGKVITLLNCSTETYSIGRRVGGIIELKLNAYGTTFSFRENNGVKLINTCAELEKINYDLSDLTDTYRLEADLIDLENWIPVGIDFNYRFKGTFDGDGHIVTIKSLYSILQYAGLFGYIDGGEVKNVGVKGNLSTTNGLYAGGIAGINDGGTIANCYATGTISLTYNNSVIYAGGIVGGNRNNGICRNCYSTNDITATGTGSSEVFAGGIAGYNRNNSQIINCYATGAVKATIFPSNILYTYAAGISTNYTDIGTIINKCVALNPSISATHGTQNYGGRISAIKSGVTNCFARDDMVLTVDATAYISAPEASVTVGEYHRADWWSDTALFSFGISDVAPWVWDSGKLLPKLYWEK